VTLSTRDRVTGAAFVVAGILLQSLLLGMPASLLSVALVIAYLLWTTESWSVRDPQLRWTYAIGIAIFVAHATEEYLTGLARRLPSLVGREPWSDAQFLAFNAVWLAIFLFAWFTYSRYPLGALVLLFFALAGGVGNGIGHLLVSLVQGTYFPGTWTAPLCAAVGAAILWRMFRRPQRLDYGRSPCAMARDRSAPRMSTRQ